MSIMNKNQKIKVPPDTIDTIIELIKKYHLGPVDLVGDPEMNEILKDAKTPEETIKRINELPFKKTLRIVKSFLRGEISNLALSIKKELNISQSVALDFSDQIKRSLPFITSSYSSSKEQETISSPEKDVYREPLK